jgi:hypothetical protein
LARTLTKLLDKYGLQKKRIVYVKDEGSNFNAMFAKFKYVVSCESFGLEESLQGTCFGHVFSKACQYRIVEKRLHKNSKYVSI